MAVVASNKTTDWVIGNPVIGANADEQKTSAARVLKLENVLKRKIEVFPFGSNQERPTSFKAVTMQFGKRRQSAPRRKSFKHHFCSWHDVSASARFLAIFQLTLK